MNIRRAVLLLLTVSALAVGGIAAQFSVAGAAAEAATVGTSATVQAHAQPNVNNFRVTDTICAYPSGCNYSYACHWGSSYGAAGPLQASQGPITKNNCSVRVWLHEYASGGGYALCINPGTPTGILHRDYRQIYISKNTSNC